MTPEIEEFAKRLIEYVRDASIRSNDVGLQSNAVGPVAERWMRAARDETPTEFARVVIPDIVDDTIFYLLHAIDEGDLSLAFTASNGKVVDLTTAGNSELAGWYMGSEGWPPCTRRSGSLMILPTCAEKACEFGWVQSERQQRSRVTCAPRQKRHALDRARSRQANGRCRVSEMGRSQSATLALLQTAMNTTFQDLQR